MELKKHSDESFNNFLYVFIFMVGAAVDHNFQALHREKCPQAALLCGLLQTASSPDYQAPACTQPAPFFTQN